MKSADMVQASTSAVPPAVLKLPVHRLDGSPTGEEVELDPRVFGAEPNEHVIYLAVKAELTNRRQGTRATLNRGLVSGGGRKPWRQKGRGTARAGSNRSPLWRHGGIIFGPQPQNFGLKLPKKVRRLARVSALSARAREQAINLIEDFDLPAPKTRSMAGFLKAFQIESVPVLLLLNESKPNIVKSCRNIPRMSVREGASASTRDILAAKRLFITKSALEGLQRGLTDD